MIDAALDLIARFGVKAAAAMCGIDANSLRAALRRAGLAPRALRRARAREVLASTAGLGSTTAARAAGIPRQTIERWRRQQRT